MRTRNVVESVRPGPPYDRRLAMKSALCLAVSVAILTAVLASPALAQSRCTTKWNPFLRQNETVCDDGTRSTEKYNPFLRQYEETITPGPSPWGGTPQPQVRCTTKYNSFLRQYEQVCY